MRSAIIRWLRISLPLKQAVLLLLMEKNMILLVLQDQSSNLHCSRSIPGHYFYSCSLVLCMRVILTSPMMCYVHPTLKEDQSIHFSGWNVFLSQQFCFIVGASPARVLIKLAENYLLFKNITIRTEKQWERLNLVLISNHMWPLGECILYTSIS